MTHRKPNDRFNFRELFDTLREPLEGSSNPMDNVLKTTASSLLDTREPRRNVRIVRVPDWFIFLGEVVSDKHDLDPNSYNESIFDKYSEN